MVPGAHAPDTEGTLPQLRSCSRPPELEDVEDTAATKMLFPTSSPSAHGLPSASDLCLGLQALSFRGWEQPWSTQDSDSSASSSSHPGEYWGRQKGGAGNSCSLPPPPGSICRTGEAEGTTDAQQTALALPCPALRHLSPSKVLVSLPCPGMMRQNTFKWGRGPC